LGQICDPKQNIYGFARAQTDIFALLEVQFPHQIQSIIATSFRLTPEIADFANNYIYDNSLQENYSLKKK